MQFWFDSAITPVGGDAKVTTINNALSDLNIQNQVIDKQLSGTLVLLFLKLYLMYLKHYNKLSINQLFNSKLPIWVSII